MSWVTIGDSDSECCPESSGRVAFGYRKRPTSLGRVPSHWDLTVLRCGGTWGCHHVSSAWRLRRRRLPSGVRCPLALGAASLAPSPRVLWPGARPLPSSGADAPDNSGPGLRPTAGGCRPRPLVVRDQGSGRAPPPPRLGVILGPATRPNPALQRAEFFRIFGACGAAPRGGGGAPPTTLILLRNQWPSS